METLFQCSLSHFNVACYTVISADVNSSSRWRSLLRYNTLAWCVKLFSQSLTSCVSRQCYGMNDKWRVLLALPGAECICLAHSCVKISNINYSCNHKKRLNAFWLNWFQPESSKSETAPVISKRKCIDWTFCYLVDLLTPPNFEWKFICFKSYT